MGMAEERITKAQKNVARMGARKADPQLNKQERHGGWLTGTQTGQPGAARKWKRATETRYRAVSGHNEAFKSWKFLDPIPLFHFLSLRKFGHNGGKVEIN